MKEIYIPKSIDRNILCYEVEMLSNEILKKSQGNHSYFDDSNKMQKL